MTSPTFLPLDSQKNCSYFDPFPLDFQWRLETDGLSIGPFWLTGLRTTWAAWPVTQNPRFFSFLMLAMYSGQIASFYYRDFFLFFIMWEFKFIPFFSWLFFMWGGAYTRLQSFFCALPEVLFFLWRGVLGMGFYGSNEPTLDWEKFANQSYLATFERILSFGFLLA